VSNHGHANRLGLLDRFGPPPALAIAVVVPLGSQLNGVLDKLARELRKVEVGAGA